MTLERLALPWALRAQLAAEAAAAFPRECCGLIEGMMDGASARALTLHPCANLSREPDSFELDPAAQFALLTALRGSGRAVIGCYHSHPNGDAAPSPRDLAGAGEDGFVWLIQTVTGAGPGAAAGYVFVQGAAGAGAFRTLALEG